MSSVRELVDRVEAELAQKQAVIDELVAAISHAGDKIHTMYSGLPSADKFGNIGFRLNDVWRALGDALKLANGGK